MAESAATALPAEASALKLTLQERLHAALPQTQCTRCGYPDCAAYARAMATQEAPLNQCPPGGAEGVARLAAILGSPALPLNPLHGLEGPRGVAVIDEDWCIGCTLCLDACPLDAIVGSNKVMHTVIEAHCTGCELCLPVCPVDCIAMENISGSQTGWQAWSPEQASSALSRYTIHSSRGSKSLGQSAKSLETEGEICAAQAKAAVIAAASAKAKAQRNNPGVNG